MGLNGSSACSQHCSNGITVCVPNQWAFLRVEILNGFKWSISMRVKLQYMGENVFFVICRDKLLIKKKLNPETIQHRILFFVCVVSTLARNCPYKS